jgi:hypothetical protein
VYELGFKHRTPPSLSITLRPGHQDDSKWFAIYSPIDGSQRSPASIPQSLNCAHGHTIGNPITGSQRSSASISQSSDDTHGCAIRNPIAGSRGHSFFSPLGLYIVTSQKGARTLPPGSMPARAVAEPSWFQTQTQTQTRRQRPSSAPSNGVDNGS